VPKQSATFLSRRLALLKPPCIQILTRGQHNCEYRRILSIRLSGGSRRIERAQPRKLFQAHLTMAPRDVRNLASWSWWRKTYAPLRRCNARCASRAAPSPAALLSRRARALRSLKRSAAARVIMENSARDLRQLARARAAAKRATAVNAAVPSGALAPAAAAALPAPLAAAAPPAAGAGALAQPAAWHAADYDAIIETDEACPTSDEEEEVRALPWRARTDSAHTELEDTELE
jgi:hypothetical protein